MEVGGLAETVQVVGSSPIIDAGSTTTGAVLSSEMTNKCRSAAASVTRCTLAPGVSTGGSVE